jgi:glycosyltransferase involved in cell wall biosynthesis
MTTLEKPARIAFLLDNLSGGGAEKVVLNLAAGLARLGHPVDLLVCKVEGVLRNYIPSGVTLVPLKPVSALRGVGAALAADPGGCREILGLTWRRRKLPNGFRYIPAIARHLRDARPRTLIAALPKANINAILARRLSGSDTRVIVGAHIHLSTLERESAKRGKVRAGAILPLIRRCYRQADRVVAVSQGVARDTTSYLGLPVDLVETIYNPVAVREIMSLSEEPLDDEWFEQRQVPVLLGIGRLVAQKDFPVLLRAFAELRKRRSARLVLLGGDPRSVEQVRHKAELQALAAELGIAEDFAMPGYKENPYPYLRRASAFVLSSRFEGFGNVLVEALFCGCPVISTDCPSGPAEILRDGEFGQLVPVGDWRAMAAAMETVLDTPVDNRMLRARGEEFSVERAVRSYDALCSRPVS